MSFSVTSKDGAPVMSFQSGSDLLTNVILSVEIARGTFFAAPDFGLRRRPQAKSTPRTARLIKQDIEEALQWLLDTGRATSIEVEVEIDSADRHRIKWRALVTGAKGNQISYEKFVEVV